VGSGWTIALRLLRNIGWDKDGGFKWWKPWKITSFGPNPGTPHFINPWNLRITAHERHKVLLFLCFSDSLIYSAILFAIFNLTKNGKLIISRSSTKTFRRKKMRRLCVLSIVMIMTLVPFQYVRAMEVGLNIEIVNLTEISTDIGWTTIDLSSYSPWEMGVRALYLAMYMGNRSTCVGDGINFIVRPMGETNKQRYLLINSIHTSSTNTDSYIQYVWLPINSSNKIEYTVSDLKCSVVDVGLIILGYN